eukprot:2314087-Rhodomonas_salina.1
MAHRIAFNESLIFKSRLCTCSHAALSHARGDLGRFGGLRLLVRVLALQAAHIRRIVEQARGELRAHCLGAMRPALDADAAACFLERRRSEAHFGRGLLERLARHLLDLLARQLDRFAAAAAHFFAVALRWQSAGGREEARCGESSWRIVRTPASPPQEEARSGPQRSSNGNASTETEERPQAAGASTIAQAGKGSDARHRAPWSNRVRLRTPSYFASRACCLILQEEAPRKSCAASQTPATRRR